MEHLANFLASDNAMLAAFIGAYISLFIYMIHRMDRVEDRLRKEIRDSSNNQKEEFNSRFDKQQEEFNNRFDKQQEEFNNRFDKQEDNHKELSRSVSNILHRVVRIETLVEMKQSDDAELTYPIPPDRSSLHDAATGVAEPSADNAQVTEATNRSDDQV